TLIPYFEGERTPNLPTATATFAGLTLGSTTRPNIARAAFEGMLCALADGMDEVLRHGVVGRRALIVGGAAQSPAVQEIGAEVFDIPVEIPEPGEYVALGAAAQAAWVFTGERPQWPLTIVASPNSAAANATHPADEAVDIRPIRQQYRDWQKHIYEPA